MPVETRSIYEKLGAARLASRDISELIGVCKGVLSDGVVNAQEALFILQWLEDHRFLTGTWPADILYVTLDKILEDGALSPTEEAELLELLVEITGVPIRVNLATVTENGAEMWSADRTLNTPTTLPLFEPEGAIEFNERHFVLTGNFLFGPRKDCEAAVQRCGGITQKGVNKQTNYLIIGEVGSEAWAHSSFGRKIEKAVYMREAGHSVYIVSEATWTKYLDK